MSLAQALKKTSQPLTEAEQFLSSKHIAYEEQADGTLAVDHLYLGNMKLEKLPDLTKVIVRGNFYCNNNQLTSLAGAPTSVGRHFDCSENQLTSLSGAPASVGGNFYCFHNQLTSLADSPASIGGDFHCSNSQLTTLTGAPASISGSFYCHDNHLTTLAGAPASIGGDFFCNNNQLTTLAGAPASVGGDFICILNQLTSLEYAPQKFKTLQSDFGEFSSWHEVPEHLRVSPETREKKRQEMHRKIAAAGVKKQVFKPAPSIRFKTGPK